MKKLFISDKFFSFTAMVGILSILIWGIISGIILSHNQSVSFFSGIVAGICVLVTYIAYKKHNKNLMKSMAGALMMNLILDSYAWHNVFTCFIDKICAPVYFILSIVFFVVHFASFGNRFSKSGLTAFSRLICVLLSVNYFVWCVCLAIQAATSLEAVNLSIGAISYPCLFCFITCIDSRLDAYRLDRESAGWTEEKGYPENYIHQYEKK